MNANVSIDMVVKLCYFSNPQLAWVAVREQSLIYKHVQYSSPRLPY